MSNEVVLSHRLDGGRRIEVVHGDITQEQVDVVVNAANRRLAHGGGVAGAIVRRGGRSIQQESNAWIETHGPLPIGGAAMTGAGRLPARHVIHAVGPIWRDEGDEPDLLRKAVQSALALADAHGLHSISLPAISSGIFGFPKPLAAEVIWEATLSYFETHPDSSLEVIRFCNIDARTVNLFREEGEKRAGRAERAQA
jgi:putative ATPase